MGRLRLVQTLLAEPDVLLLDEPTNHLDLPSTEWLENFLRGYSGTVLVVSHDRVFLERLSDHILHLEGGTPFPYTGSYQAFLAQREERRAVQQKEWEKQQVHIARTEEFIRRNLAGQKTKQAKSRRTQLARLERTERPVEDGRAMALGFGAARRSGGVVLKLDGATCAPLAGEPLFRPFSAEVSRGERIAVIGPNGCGKSALLRAVVGDLPPRSGEVAFGAGVQAALYSQDLTHLDPDKKVLEEVASAAPTLPTPALRDHLGRFLFSGDEQEARVGDLSGGEQARVALAKMTLQRVNLLLLDEPTNHLDIESREALEEALESFDGTVVLVSHDRALLSAVATRVWSFAKGRIEDFSGTFDEWNAYRSRSVAQEAVRVAAPRAADPAPKSGLSKNEEQRRRRELERLEARIAELEDTVATGEARLADPGLYAPGTDPELAQKLAEERETAQAELNRLYAEWERAGEALVGV